MHDYQVIVLIGLLSIGLCLECHVCYFATDPTLCRHHVTCSSGQSCGRLKFEDFTGPHYDLDCVDNSRCRNVVQTPESVGVFGRRRAVSDVECCHTDLCNRDTSHTAEQRSTTESPGNLSTELLTTVTIPPSTASEVQTSTSDNCSDHPDCDILTQGFNACNDSDIALIVCRRSCGMCDVTTTTPLCSDAHPDCQILSDHLNVCENNNFARTRCPWTCGLCDSSPSSTIFSTVSPTTEQKSGACEDGHDCELLKELNICENPLTAQLCPVYCGICLNYTQNSTISTPFSQTTTTNISTTLTSLGETTIETTESTTAQTTTQPTEHTATQTTGLTTEVTSTTSTMTTTEDIPCQDTVPTAICQRILNQTSTACSEAATQAVCKLTCNLCGNVTAASSINTSIGGSSLETTTSVSQNSQRTTTETGGETTITGVSSRITTQPIQTTVRTTTTTMVSEVGVVVIG